jgi:iron complex transport system ATP-binding protein
MSLAADALEVRYGNTLAVQATTVNLEPGDLIALIGPNGAGKTSLLRALAGIPVASSSVSWQARPLTSLAAAATARTIAYLPQAPRANWPLTVRELVELGRLPHRRFGQRFQASDRRAVEHALQLTDMTALAGRAVDRLSGGEAMRAHLARAFAVDAPVLLVDEPVASLDPYHQLSVMQCLAQYRDAGRLVVAVLHDLNLALGHCSRLLLMNAGRIVADGEPRNVIDAAALREHYSIRAYLAEYEQRRIAVPWEMLDG